MLSVLYAESADNLAHLLRFYVPDGGTLLDVTFGGGTLSKRAPMRVVGIDCDQTTKADVYSDAGHLPFREACFSAAVFDPPYLYGSVSAHHGVVGTSTWDAKRTTWKTPRQLVDLSRRVASELARVLVLDGVSIVKIMDSRYKGKLIRNHDLVADAFERQGWILVDQIVYVRTVTGSFVNNVSAQCAHGYYLVFKRHAQRSLLALDDDRAMEIPA